MAVQTASGGGFQHQTQMLTLNEPERQPIPLVGHIITDEDVGALQGAKLQTINLNKVVKLLTDPHSAMLYDRHMHALKKVVKYYSKGFLMKDLVAVFKILNVCADRIEEHAIYIEPMLSILQICSLPFFKEKSSDENAFEQIAIESISQLGYLMRVPCDEVRIQICDTLTAFYCNRPPTQNVQKHKANTLAYNQRIVEQSDVSETLVKSLALLEQDLPVRIKVLECLQRLSKSASNCEQMLRSSAAERLASRLMDHDPSGQLLFRSSDILWNLLENGDKDQVANQLNGLTCISQLRDAFLHQLTQGYSHYDRQLRNDLLVIASLTGQIAHNAPFLETGFVKQLTLFATFQEVKSHHVLTKHLKLLQNPEDFELKKLIINILVILSKESAVLPVLSEGKLLLALFTYVRANEKPAVPASGQEWTPAQFEELQLHAMSALATLAPLMVEDYMMCQGNTRLLLLLEWCVGPDDFGGTGNSFHGAGGRSNKKAQMRLCLRLIRSMVSSGGENVLQDMTDQGAINQITGILSNIMRRRKQQEHFVDVEMQCDMLFILSALCENDMHRKELFGQSGVDVVVEYLRTDLGLLSSGLGHHRLLLAAVDAVWCAVIGCFMTEDYFLEKEGVFLLIDLLESCPKNMHNLILGTLLDLSENPKAMSHISAWRGKGDISAAHLLCNTWREEEKEMGVERESGSGALSDVNRPLMGKLQEEQGITPLPASCPSQAIVDVSENMRAKIYAIFGKIGFIELPGLTTEDHVTLTVIEHYLDFKLGEVWTEVIDELGQESIRPITPDREALEAISRTVTDRAQHVAMVQKELLDAQKQQDLIDEQEHYAEIRENHRQQEKALRDFHDYVARTSNHRLLVAAKQRQELSIDASRVQNNYNNADTFHNTEVPKLNTTPWYDIYLPASISDHLPTPTSLDSDDCNLLRCFQNLRKLTSQCADSMYANSGGSSTSTLSDNPTVPLSPPTTASSNEEDQLDCQFSALRGMSPAGEKQGFVGRSYSADDEYEEVEDHDDYLVDDLHMLQACTYSGQRSNEIHDKQVDLLIVSHDDSKQIIESDTTDEDDPNMEEEEDSDDQENYPGSSSAEDQEPEKLKSAPTKLPHEFDLTPLSYDLCKCERTMKAANFDPDVYRAMCSNTAPCSGRILSQRCSYCQTLLNRNNSSGYGRPRQASSEDKSSTTSLHYTDSDTSELSHYWSDYHGDISGESVINVVHMCQALSHFRLDSTDSCTCLERFKSLRSEQKNCNNNHNVADVQARDRTGYYSRMCDAVMRMYRNVCKYIALKNQDVITEFDRFDDVFSCDEEDICIEIKGHKLAMNDPINDDEVIFDAGKERVKGSTTARNNDIQSNMNNSNSNNETLQVGEKQNQPIDKVETIKTSSLSEHLRNDPITNEEINYNNNRTADYFDVKWWKEVTWQDNYEEQLGEVESFLARVGSDPNELENFMAESGMYIIDPELEGNLVEAAEDEEVVETPEVEIELAETPSLPPQSQASNTGYMPTIAMSQPTDVSHYISSQIMQWNHGTSESAHLLGGEVSPSPWQRGLRVGASPVQVSYEMAHMLIDGAEDQDLTNEELDHLVASGHAQFLGFVNMLSEIPENYVDVMTTPCMIQVVEKGKEDEHNPCESKKFICDMLSGVDADMNEQCAVLLADLDGSGIRRPVDLQTYSVLITHIDEDECGRTDGDTLLIDANQQDDEEELVEEEHWVLIPANASLRVPTEHQNRSNFAQSSETQCEENRKETPEEDLPQLPDDLVAVRLKLFPASMNHGVKVQTVGYIHEQANEMFVVSENIDQYFHIQLSKSEKYLQIFSHCPYRDGEDKISLKNIPVHIVTENGGEIIQDHNGSLQWPRLETCEENVHKESESTGDINKSKMKNESYKRMDVKKAELDRLMEDELFAEDVQTTVKRLTSGTNDRDLDPYFFEFLKTQVCLIKQHEDEELSNFLFHDLVDPPSTDKTEDLPSTPIPKESVSDILNRTFGTYAQGKESKDKESEGSDSPPLLTCTYDPLNTFYRAKTYVQLVCDILTDKCDNRFPHDDPCHFWRTPEHVLELVRTVNGYDLELMESGQSRQLYSKEELTFLHQNHYARLWCTMVKIQQQHWLLGDMGCCSVTELPEDDPENHTLFWYYLDSDIVNVHLAQENMTQVSNKLSELLKNWPWSEEETRLNKFVHDGEKKYSSIPDLIRTYQRKHVELRGLPNETACNMACLINARLHNTFWIQHEDLLVALMNTFSLTRLLVDCSFGRVRRQPSGESVFLLLHQEEYLLGYILYMMTWVERRFSRACEIATGHRDVKDELSLLSLLKPYGLQLFKTMLWKQLENVELDMKNDEAHFSVGDLSIRAHSFGGFGLKCMQKAAAIEKYIDQQTTEMPQNVKEDLVNHGESIIVTQISRTESDKKQFAKTPVPTENEPGMYSLTYIPEKISHVVDSIEESMFHKPWGEQEVISGSIGEVIGSYPDTTAVKEYVYGGFHLEDNVSTFIKELLEQVPKANEDEEPMTFSVNEAFESVPVDDSLESVKEVSEPLISVDVKESFTPTSFSRTDSVTDLNKCVDDNHCILEDEGIDGLEPEVCFPDDDIGDNVGLTSHQDVYSRLSVRAATGLSNGACSVLEGGDNTYIDDFRLQPVKENTPKEECSKHFEIPDTTETELFDEEIVEDDEEETDLVPISCTPANSTACTSSQTVEEDPQPKASNSRDRLNRNKDSEMNEKLKQLTQLYDGDDCKSKAPGNIQAEDHIINMDVLSPGIAENKLSSMTLNLKQPCSTPVDFRNITPIPYRNSLDQSDDHLDTAYCRDISDFVRHAPMPPQVIKEEETMIDEGLTSYDSGVSVSYSSDTQSVNSFSHSFPCLPQSKGRLYKLEDDHLNRKQKVYVEEIQQLEVKGQQLISDSDTDEPVADLRPKKNKKLRRTQSAEPSATQDVLKVNVDDLPIIRGHSATHHPPPTRKFSYPPRRQLSPIAPSPLPPLSPISKPRETRSSHGPRQEHTTIIRDIRTAEACTESIPVEVEENEKVKIPHVDLAIPSPVPPTPKKADQRNHLSSFHFHVDRHNPFPTLKDNPLEKRRTKGTRGQNLDNSDMNEDREKFPPLKTRSHALSHNKVPTYSSRYVHDVRPPIIASEIKPSPRTTIETKNAATMKKEVNVKVPKMLPDIQSKTSQFHKHDEFKTSVQQKERKKKHEAQHVEFVDILADQKLSARHNALTQTFDVHKNKPVESSSKKTRHSVTISTVNDSVSIVSNGINPDMKSQLKDLNLSGLVSKTGHQCGSYMDQASARPRRKSLSFDQTSDTRRGGKKSSMEKHMETNLQKKSSFEEYVRESRPKAPVHVTEYSYSPLLRKKSHESQRGSGQDKQHHRSQQPVWTHNVDRHEIMQQCLRRSNVRAEVESRSERRQIHDLADRKWIRDTLANRGLRRT